MFLPAFGEEAFLAGADNADGGDAVGRLEGPRFPQLLRIEARDGKEAVRAEHIAQHVPVARLKDVERHQRLRKKRHVGQRHDRHIVG